MHRKYMPSCVSSSVSYKVCATSSSLTLFENVKKCIMFNFGTLISTESDRESLPKLFMMITQDPQPEVNLQWKAT